MKDKPREDKDKRATSIISRDQLVEITVEVVLGALIVYFITDVSFLGLAAGSVFVYLLLSLLVVGYNRIQKRRKKKGI